MPKAFLKKAPTKWASRDVQRCPVTEAGLLHVDSGKGG